MTHRPLVSPILAALLALAPATLAAPGLAASDATEAAAALDADEVLERALQALGGVARLSRIETVETRGTVDARGLAGAYLTWRRKGDRLRTDVDFEVIRIEQAFDGENGWTKQLSRTSAVTGAELDELARKALFLPLLAYRERGLAARLAGREEVDGAAAYVLEIAASDRLTDRFFIDAESFLPLREESRLETPEGTVEWSNTFTDYRPVDGVIVPFGRTFRKGEAVQVVTHSEIRFGEPQPEDLYLDPRERHADAPYAVTLSTIPRRVFKENDGVWEEGATESWVFHVVVAEEHDRPLDPLGAVIEIYRGDERVERLELTAEALAPRQGVRFATLAAQREVFDLRHEMSRPVAAGIDRLVYRLRLAVPEGEPIEASLDVPVERYEQKTELIFPLRGRFVVLAGHAANEAHKQEWSQHYAEDILALGERYELLRGSGGANEDFVTWGAEVIAPAAGRVVYARNDVPDNPRPGVTDRAALRRMPDLRNAIGGNNVIIDHGNGEFSFLAHMIHGSVRVETGDRVEQGQVLGLLGNSGNSDGPHLHYHLMAGPELMRSDGLPARFGNLYIGLFGGPGEEAPMKILKRGIPLIAKPVGGAEPDPGP